jgi:hypothetical protein
MANPSHNERPRREVLARSTATATPGSTADFLQMIGDWHYGHTGLPMTKRRSLPLGSDR